MKKIYILLAVTFLYSQTVFSQLNGTYTIPGSYANILAAINDLNTQGVSGPVTFNIAAGHVETGANYIINVTGPKPDATNTVTFQKSGSGANPRIETNAAGLGTVTTTGFGTNGDAFIKINGDDYITFDGIDMTDLYTGTATAQKIEYGIMLCRATSTDGCKNITIRNCTIIFALTNATCVSSGVYTSNFNSAGTSVSATTIGGRHENIFIDGNHIGNAIAGFYFNGTTDATPPYNLYDNNIQVGVTSGNTLICGQRTTTQTNTAYGIYAINCDSIKFNNNLMRVNVGANNATHYGIFTSTGTNSVVEINGNNISDTSTAASATTLQAGIVNTFGTSGTDNRVIITNNTIANCFYATPGTTATATYIQNLAGGFTIRISNNTIQNNVYGNGSTAATGTITGILQSTANSTAGATLNIDSNNVNNLIRQQNVAGTGQTMGIQVTASSHTTNLIRNNVNNITNNTTTSTLSGINVSSAAASTMNISHNTIHTIQRTAGNTTGATYGLFASQGSPTNNVFNNTIYNINNTVAASTSVTYGFYDFGLSTTVVNFYGNTIYNVNSAGTGVVHGAFQQNGTVPVKNVYNNTIYNISGGTTTGGQRIGLSLAYGTTTNCYNNRIYNVSSNFATGSPSAAGIAFLTAGTTHNVYNNFISEIYAPNSTVSVTGVIGLWFNFGTAANVYYNTIYLDGSSSGTGFGSSALWTITAGFTLDMRNNILINRCTPTGAGIVSAYTRNSTTLTTYASTSNNNNLFAGTPGPQRLLFYDYTNAIQTLSAYKTFVSPRDAASITENTPFVNTTTSPYDLHISTCTPSQCESGGATVSGITTDYDGHNRYPNSGHPNCSTFSAIAPDIGADEFGGQYVDLVPPVISYTPLPNDVVGTGRTFSGVSITDPGSGVNVTPGTRPRCYYKKSTDANTYAGNTAFNNGWKWVESTGGSSPFTFNIDYTIIFGGSVSIGDVIQYFVVAQDLASTPNVGINSGTFSGTPASVADYANIFPLSGTIRQYNIGASYLGTYTVPSITFPTLTGTGGFFDAINTGVVAGNITLQVTADLTEPGTHALNPVSYDAGGPYSITIVPADPTEKVISGSVGDAMIRFNGASRVTINGNIFGTRYLRFRNTNGLNPTFLFQNDAQRITLTNCIIESNNAGTLGTTATIVVGGTTGTQGNDSIFITNCDIRDRSDAAGTPICAVLSSGNASYPNDYLTISGCNIYNTFNSSATFVDLYIIAGNDNVTVSNNSFYQTTTRSPLNTAAYFALIFASNGSINLTNNFLGGTAPNCGGAPLTYTDGGGFLGFRLFQTSTGVASTVSGNTVANIDYATTSTGSPFFFRAFDINGNPGANVNVTGNTIGSLTSNDNIILRYNPAAGTGNPIPCAIGFGFNSGVTGFPLGSVTNNTIGGITLTGTGTTTGTAFTYTMIGVGATVNTSVNVNGNTIGGTIADNIRNSLGITTGIQMNGISSAAVSPGSVNISNNTIRNLTNNNSATATNNLLRGIFHSGTASFTCNSNTIRDLSTTSGNTSGTSPSNASLIGILTTSSSTGQTISQNTIFSLTNNNTGSGTVYAIGIGINNTSATGTVSRNRIYDISIPAMTGGPPTIMGIDNWWGTWTVANNQISLTNDELTLSSAGNEPNPIGESYMPVMHSDKSFVNPVSDNHIRQNYNNRNSDRNPLVTEGEIPQPENRDHEKLTADQTGNISYHPMATNGVVIYGIFDDATTAQTYYYNSVYVGGSASVGSANSFAFRKNTPTHVLRNNLFVNARFNTGTATGSHYVIQSVNTTAGSINTNYNTYIGSNAATIGLWGTTNQTISQWRTSIGSGPGQDKQTWSTVTSSFNVSNLFADITNGNLNIQAGNTEAWIVNGKGIPVTGFGTDFNGNTRSTTIAGGVTDIGSHEVAVNHVTNPPPIADFDFAPGSGVTSTYSQWSRTLAVVTWGTGGGSYPSALNVRYYSGVNPPGTLGGNFSNSYWDMTAIGTLSGTQYDITLHFGDNEVYTITTPASNTVLAKYDGTWEVFPNGTGPWQTTRVYNTATQVYTVATTFIDRFSQFALTDASNPLPVIISSFDVHVQNRDANLVWVTEQEINNKGFAVERRIKTNDGYSRWQEIAFVDGHGTTYEQKIYKYTDKRLQAGIYQYRLKQVDYNGNYEYYERQDPDVVIGKPVAFDLGQNYPNPANPKCKIDFALPFDAKVTIKVYDILGREVATLLDAFKTADYYTVEFDGTNVASGTYFYRITADNNGQTMTKTLKMILVK